MKPMRTSQLPVLRLIVGLAGACLMGTALPATAQTVSQTAGQIISTEDISAQLQASLTAAAPTIVYFDFDKDTLTSETRATLAQQAAWLRGNPNAKVDLAGHTDAVGSDSYNVDLAMRRAQAVENHLLGQGVASVQMRSVVSRGKSELAVSTPKRERLNRRVTTSVTGQVTRVATRPSQPMPIPAAPSPARRTYTDVPVTVCSDRSRNLFSAESTSELRSQLDAHMSRAVAFERSSAGQSDLSGAYHRAIFTKVQCATAIGYSLKGIRDSRSIENCVCTAKTLNAG